MARVGVGSFTACDLVVTVEVGGVAATLARHEAGAERTTVQVARAASRSGGQVGFAAVVGDAVAVVEAHLTGAGAGHTGLIGAASLATAAAAAAIRRRVGLAAIVL